jgi:hypothetical protein
VKYRPHPHPLKAFVYAGKTKDLVKRKANYKSDEKQAKRHSGQTSSENDETKYLIIRVADGLPIPVQKNIEFALITSFDIKSDEIVNAINAAYPPPLGPDFAFWRKHSLNIMVNVWNEKIPQAMKERKVN